MCEVCDQKGTLAERIKPFLKEGAEVELTRHEEWEIITLRHAGKTLQLTADGDEGGYFHHEASEAG